MGDANTRPENLAHFQGQVTPSLNPENGRDFQGWVMASSAPTSTFLGMGRLLQYLRSLFSNRFYFDPLLEKNRGVPTICFYISVIEL